MHITTTESKGYTPTLDLPNMNADKAGKFMRVYYKVDMRYAHDGLSALASRGRNGVDVKELQEGQFLLFLNSQLNRMKLFASNGVIAYLKVKGKIDLHTIQMIPAAFKGGKIEYSSLLKKRLEKVLHKRISSLN